MKHAAYLAIIVLSACHLGASAGTAHAPTLARIADDRPPQGARSPLSPTVRASLVPVGLHTQAVPSVELIKTLGDVIDARCNGVVSPPSEQTIMVEGQPVKQRCGLLSELFRPVDYEHFVTEICNDTLTAVSAECLQNWYGRFISSVMARYSAADWRTFPAWCEGHPSDCDDLPKTEIWFLSSHSSQLYAAYNDQLAAHPVSN